MKKCSLLSGIFLAMAVVSYAQTQTATQPSAQSATTTPGATVGHGPQPPVKLTPPTKDDLLRGAYGPYRANNDLLFYHLDLRVDPVEKTIRGTNTVRFRMLQDGNRIQFELSPSLDIDSIKLGSDTLKYTREERTVWIDF